MTTLDKILNGELKTQVYWNSHKKCYSFRYRGKVILRSENSYLKDCIFKVSEKSRQKVIKNKTKNVHAYIEGKICSSVSIPEENKFYYNPYKMEQFTSINGDKLKTASYIFLDTDYEKKKPRCYYRKD